MKKITLKAVWSCEQEPDIQVYYGMDTENELIECMCNEVYKEVMARNSIFIDNVRMGKYEYSKWV